jgi:hypothetical protein
MAYAWMTETSSEWEQEYKNSLLLGHAQTPLLMSVHYIYARCVQNNGCYDKLCTGAHLGLARDETVMWQSTRVIETMYSCEP